MQKLQALCYMQSDNILADGVGMKRHWLSTVYTIPYLPGHYTLCQQRERSSATYDQQTVKVLQIKLRSGLSYHRDLLHVSSPHINTHGKTRRAGEGGKRDDVRELHVRIVPQALADGCISKTLG